jgi:hypothetical protein
MLTGEHAYEESRRIHAETRGAGFYPLLMAALRAADSENLERIRAVLPDVVAELQARYDAPGGVLPAEKEAEIEGMQRPPVRELVNLAVPDSPRLHPVYYDDIDDEDM